MRLTQWTDYGLRVLMYCAAQQGRASAPTIAEIATAHGISRSHLMKVVMKLSALGWLETTRGRGGGLRLMQPAEQIGVGQVVRQLEEDFRLVECFDLANNGCRLEPQCRLKGALQQALQAYMQVLDGLRLSDLQGSAADPRGAGLSELVFHPRPEPLPARQATATDPYTP